MGECFNFVRGSVIRVTGLSLCGSVTHPVRYATSKSVSKVTITDVTESSSNEIISTPEEERRLHLVKDAVFLRSVVDIEFLRVDPGILSLVSGVPLVEKPPTDPSLVGFDRMGFGVPFVDATASGPGFDTTGFGVPVDDPSPSSYYGFGEGSFGEFYFGGEDGIVVGFESGTRSPLASFGLEVWSNLAGQKCEGGSRAYGYTVFPYLRGGRLSGFTFDNGLVSFRLTGARAGRHPRWNVGPHDIEGEFKRHTSPVSRNTNYRMVVTPGAPPKPLDGVQVMTDTLDNGTAANPMPDPDARLVLDAGGVDTDPWIIDGGWA